MNIASSFTDSQRAEYYLTLPSIRDQCFKVFILAQEGKLDWFEYHPEKEADVMRFCENLLQRDWKDQHSKIPPHGRHRHFDIDNSPPRLAPLVSKIRESVSSSSSITESDLAKETTKSLLDLFLVSVLLDAGAGPKWSYKEKDTDLTYARSEGLAIAGLDMFKSGLFSSDSNYPYRADADALEKLTSTKIAEAMQISESNPLEGLEGRVELLRNLSGAMKSHPEHFGQEGGGRPGGIIDFLLSEEAMKGDGKPKIHVSSLWHVLIHSLSSIWPSRHELGGVKLGDAWPCPALSSLSSFSSSPSVDQNRKEGKQGPDPEIIVPFHKLTQWLTWSLIALLQRSAEDGGLGWNVEGTEDMTGLPEYRNGGLLVDLGLLTLKQSALDNANPRIERSEAGLWRFEPGHPAVVEWRALTVIMLDRIHSGLNKELQLNLTLPQVLEAVTWKGGREIAKSKRDDGGPPIEIISDGTVF